MPGLLAVQKELRKYAHAKKATHASRFFKTGPGEYGEGDVFIGVVVPDTRRVAKMYQNLSLSQLQEVLKSPIHEDRLLALVILTLQFAKASPEGQQKIFNFYLKNKKFINNWDLVDVTTPAIVGGWLFNRDRKILDSLVMSKRLWDRRIALLSTFYFIRNGDFQDALRFARLLLKDREDLIHKAAGWMLREIGKRDRLVLRNFLKKHATQMPRTMLRYSIEHLSKAEQKRFLARKFV